MRIPRTIRKKRLYLVLAALRGPDNQDNMHDLTLKSMLTARIRAIFFSERDCGGIREPRRFTEAEYNLLREVCGKRGICGKPGNSHFREHLARAVYYSQSHRIWNGYGAKIYEILMCS